MLSVGALIWVAFRPLIKLMLCVAGGFIITKADIFPAVAARGAGQIALNITMPCLMFSKILPSFSTENIAVLLPLVTIALIYISMGLAISWITKQIFWVPHRFRYGILAAGGWSNCGDLPTAVIISIAANSPFKGESDQNLSIAYISALILVYTVTFFPLGGIKLVAMDFEGPDVEPEEVQQALKQKQRRIIQRISSCFGRKPAVDDEKRAPAAEMDPEKQQSEPSPLEGLEKIDESAHVHWNETNQGSSTRPHYRRHVSFFDEASTAVPTEGPTRPPSPVDAGEAKMGLVSPAPTLVPETLYRDDSPASRPLTPVQEGKGDRNPIQPTFARKVLLFFKGFLLSLCMPVSLSILLSFPIALIKPLKALFIEVPDFYMPSAPDGGPPLGILYDFAEFMGAASVPLNLICLGSALARLNVPRSQWPTLPLGAIFSLALGRMVLMPIIGVLICVGLISIDFISKEDKVLQFICIFFSCLPTATTQVFVTQVYSGTGSAEHFSAFLIPQYIIMFLSMTVLSAYALQIIF